MDNKMYEKKDLDNDLVLKLLSAINGGANKAKLESVSGVSSSQVHDYLQELIKDGLVGYEVSDGTTLVITEKGSRFLLSYERVAASQVEHEPPRGLLDLH